MKKKCLMAIVLGLFFTLSPGCSRSIAVPPDAAALARLSVAVESASPGQAEKMLADKGYDETSFRKAVEEIMENPDSVVIFADAYRAASKESGRGAPSRGV